MLRHRLPAIHQAAIVKRCALETRLMKSLLRILRYVKNYKLSAGLMAGSNVFAAIFEIFSLGMLVPLLDLIFQQSDTQYQEHIAKGVPALELSASSVVEAFNYYLANMIVQGGDNGKIDALIFIAVLVGSMLAIKNVFRYMALFWAAPMRTGVVRDVRNGLYDKIVSLPLGYFSEQRKGDMIARMSNDVTELEWTILRSLEMLFRDPIKIILFLAMLIFLSPQLTLFVFVFLPIPVIVISRISKSLKASSVKSQAQQGQLLALIEETLGGIRIIKAFTAEVFSNARFQAMNERFRVLLTRVYRKRDLASPVSESLMVWVILGTLVFGGYLILSSEQVFGMSSDLTPSQFLVYIAALSQLLEPIKSLTNAVFNLQKGAASEERINELLAAENNITEVANPSPLTEFKENIEFRDVTFAYDTEAVLKGINLTIPRGKTVALVGPSGGGKSTLADLVPRYFDPTSGEILLDGVPITQCGLTDMRKLMGIVTQESILFNDTIAGNIAFGLDTIDMNAVQEAAKVANAHQFISEMENGYNTNIGDRGTKLSGGQRQRISIARAILKNPPILILDEATSALDTESEKLVQDALNKLMQNRTSLVIAHRLSTIQTADEIVVIVDGAVAEQGTHDGLLAKDGVYKRLFDLQSFA